MSNQQGRGHRAIPANQINKNEELNNETNCTANFGKTTHHVGNHDRNIGGNHNFGNWRNDDNVEHRIGRVLDLDGDTVDIANGNDGTLREGDGANGLPTFATGIVGQALSLDGLNDYIEIPDTGAVNLDGFSEMTVSAWINPTSYDPGYVNGIVVKYQSYYFALREGRVQINIYGDVPGADSVGGLAEPQVPLGEWTHVAAVWNGGSVLGSIQIYINGQPANLIENHVGPVTTNRDENDPVNIGAFAGITTALSGLPQNSPFGLFHGLIDEVRIHDQALTAAQVHSHYQSAFNQNPTADAGPDQFVECTSSAGALVTLFGAGSDPDNDDLTYSWDVPDGISLNDPSSPTPSGVFPIGITTATLTVDDGNGGLAVDAVLITVEDTTPPEVHCTTDVAALWPPNHQQVPVQIFVGATDACSNPGELFLTSLTIASNEPDNGLDDGDTSGDVSGLDGFVNPVELAPWFTYNSTTGSFEGIAWLRAERSGNGSGRSYTIQATVVDSHNNLASSSCVVVVPKNKRKPK